VAVARVLSPDAAPVAAPAPAPVPALAPGVGGAAEAAKLLVRLEFLRECGIVLGASGVEPFAPDGLAGCPGAGMAFPVYVDWALALHDLVFVQGLWCGGGRRDREEEPR